MGEVLSEEDVNAIRRWSHVQAADEADDLHALCDSHEELRRQRDEARVMFCRAAARCAELGGEPSRPNWPDEAARLFPEVG